MPRNIFKEMESIGLPINKPRNVLQEKEGQWEGWIKPALKEIGGGIAGTPETLFSLANSMALWPIQKVAGLSRVLTGDTAEEARQTEEQIGQAFGYQPKIKEAQGAVDLVGKGFDLLLTPARMAGDELKHMGYPKAGYLAELGAELATFKIAHGVKGKATSLAKQKSSAKSLLNKKLSDLTIEQRRMVNDLADAKSSPRNIVKEHEIVSKDPLETAYETQKDIWLGKRDLRMFEADIEARLLKKEIKAIDKKQAPILDEAIQVYIDTKRNPSHVEAYYNKLKPEQKRIVTLSQNLSNSIKAIADKIEQSYEGIGAHALSADVIRNTIDNYAARKWDLKGTEAAESMRKFGTKTGHAKARKFETIIEGWANGYDLKVKTATENLRIYKHEIVKTIQDKKFVEELRKIKDIDGNKLLSTQQLEGYVHVEHPNMSVWEWAGKMEEGKTYGKNFFATEDGALFERRKLYAPKDQAKNINNMLGISKLAEVPGIKGLTKFNAVTKAWILQSSLFHHMAFMRSFYLPSMRAEMITPRQAYKQGIESIERSDPIIMNGVRNGLTLGLKQDWSEQLLREKTKIGAILDKNRVTKITKDAITKFREAQADFLFGEFGAGLKAKTYELEFRSQMKKHPNTNPDVIAKRVALLINDDFGGLHLQRLGRDPTLQHIFRLFALAPDWTESNIRTMVKTLKNKSGDAAELAMYREFWGGVIVKGLGATAIANLLLSGADTDEMVDNYKEAWKSGNKNWMKIDITPIYKLVGGSSGQKKYFSALGHFQDPLKFLTDPAKAAHHKGSVVYGVGHEFLAGTDWAARKFTTFEELLDEKKTVKWGQGGPISYEQFPSYVLSQMIGTQPVQMQNFIGWMTGEIEGFDALSRSIGLNTTSTYNRKTRGFKRLKKLPTGK